MPSTLSIEEGEPTTWPQVDPSDDGPTIPATAEEDEPEFRKYTRAAWQRVQGWIAYRWTVRACVFMVEGPGDWIAPLQPFTATTKEQWIDNAWASVTLAPTALGGFAFDAVGPYRITGNLGTANPPPEVVRQAVYRLAQYFQAADAVSVGERTTSSYKMDLGGSLSVQHDRNPNWMARALQQSGAADLLRPWRKLGAR